MYNYMYIIFYIDTKKMKSFILTISFIIMISTQTFRNFSVVYVSFLTKNLPLETRLVKNSAQHDTVQILRKQYYANPSVAAANIKSSRSVHTLHLKACIRLIPRCPQRKNEKAICNSMPLVTCVSLTYTYTLSHFYTMLINAIALSD